MARIAKKGLDYFPLDVNFLSNRKVRRLFRKHGPVTVINIIALFTCIYREEGYYLVWNEDTCFDLCEQANTDMASMQAFIADAIRTGLFDSEQFKTNGILTSASIQEQYRTCTMKRKTNNIEEKFRLISDLKDSAQGTDSENSSSESTADMPIPGENKGVNDTEMQQSKEQDKERKAEENTANLPCPSPAPRRGSQVSMPGPSPERGDLLLVEGRWVPEYCLNKKTHNYDGLLYRLAEIRVKEEKEVDAIVKLSNYGQLGHPVWHIISYNNWPKGNVIKLPGRFILSQLSKERK